jgi:hypothetical protein
MGGLRVLVLRFLTLFRKGHLEQELGEELSSHVNGGGFPGLLHRGAESHQNRSDGGIAV